VHGRGLALKPIVDQIDAFDLITDAGLVTCSREQHRELFQLGIGGYGLFGVVTRLTLRLCPRVKVRRVVSLIDAGEVIDAFDDRIRAGFTYGDFQFAIDPGTDAFLRRGVFSCYEPVPDNVPATESPIRFRPEDWSRLTVLAHTDKRRAFDAYAERYLETSGQVYWADEQQLTVAYLDDYHQAIDRATNAAVPGSEMITEILVPRGHLSTFMEDARAELLRRRANVIYGTVRLIEPEDETVLAWARDRYACVALNLHVDHTERAIAGTADVFRALIDLALRHGGSYYLTYHRWARKDQVEASHPRLIEFLKMKRDHDPFERFQSEWYRHYRDMFATS
jgi:FAD/FMN-containing dehydrogenase